jgi:hypothetical protein
MRRAAATVAPLLAVLALVLAGCGTTTLTAAQMRTQAGRICAHAAERAARIPAPATPDASERFLRAGLGAMRPAAEGLRALKPPDEMRESYGQAVALNAKALASVARQEHAIARGEDAPTAFRRLQAELDPIVRVEDATWRALQIPACVTR